MKNQLNFSGSTLIATRDDKELQLNIEDLYFIYNDDYFNIMLDESHTNSGLAVFSSKYSDLTVDGSDFTGGADDLEALVKSHIGGGGGEITIDAALDANSPNAVANSAITTAIKSKISDIKRQESRVFGEGTTRLSVSYDGGGYFDITFAASINNKPILREPYSSYNFSLIETSAITTSLSSSSTDSQVPSAKAVTTQLNNKTNKSAAVGGYKFGASNNVDYIQYINVNANNIGNEIYYPKINGKGIFTNNQTFARDNYNFSLVETSAIQTTLSSSSTDSQVPSAKAVYDALGNIETLLSQI